MLVPSWALSSTDHFVVEEMRDINKNRLLIEQQDRGSSEEVPLFVSILDLLLKVTLTKGRGLRNAFDVKLENADFVFPDLPRGFDGTRILQITDLHLDGVGTLAQHVTAIADKIDYDYCILGGDYYSARDDGYGPARSQIERMAKGLTGKSRVFGVLGNYDLYRTGEVLANCGVEMLINEGICLERNADRIYLAGVDDGSHYRAADISLADSNAWDGAFKIIVCHSPSLHNQADQAGYSLYLTGDTHGGQICLPYGFVPFCGPTASRKMAKGKWKHGSMLGYTSRGVGTSRIKVRYFCPPEITMITLRNSKQ